MSSEFVFLTAFGDFSTVVQGQQLFLCQRALLPCLEAATTAAIGQDRDRVWRRECSIEMRPSIEFLLLPSHSGLSASVEVARSYRLVTGSR